MNYWTLVLRESSTVRRSVVFAVVFSSLSNAALLTIINAAATAPAGSGLHLQLLLLFTVALLLYIQCLRYSTRTMNRMMSDVVHTLRSRFVEKLGRAELPALESTGKSDILNAMTAEATLIADSGALLSNAFQALLVVLFATAYIAYLSVLAFVVTVSCMVLALVLMQSMRSATSALHREERSREVEFLTRVTHLIEGFKETKMHAQRGLELRSAISRTSRASANLRVSAKNLVTDRTILAQSSWYVAIALVVFLLPRFLSADTLPSVTTAILFMIGPQTLWVNATSHFVRCEEATRVIHHLEMALDRYHAMDRRWSLASGAVDIPTALPMGEIALDGVQYSYRGAEGTSFTLGPVSLRMRPGQIVFLAGGNGSGKSSLLKILSGLYPLEAGTITVRGRAVDAGTIANYRQLFAPVFADFHLFDRLYGLLDAPRSRFEVLLEEMQLERKLRIEDDRFSTLDLSTGQRKRLALIVALMDDRPIYLFDELAADQDPEFRAFLYTVLLPRLRDAGHLVIAATHDDRYFHIADLVVHMEYGVVRRIEGPAADNGLTAAAEHA
jgi:putative ATP-binding cassette transporter